METEEPDKELIRLTLSDIQYIRKHWNQDTSDETLRRTSTILRNLLIYRWIPSAWGELKLPGACTFTTGSLSKTLEIFPKEWINFAQAGGAPGQLGIIIKNPISIIIPPDSRIDNDEVRKRFDLHDAVSDFTETVKVGRFLTVPTLVAEGFVYTKQDVIEYVVNKTGGAHYTSPEKYNPIESQKLLALDRASGRFVSNRNAVVFELLSIGRCVVDSHDIKRFIWAAREFFMS